MADNRNSDVFPAAPKGGSGTVAVAIDRTRALVASFKDGHKIQEFEQGIDECLQNGIAVLGQPHPPRVIVSGAGRMNDRFRFGCRRVRYDQERVSKKATIGSLL